MNKLTKILLIFFFLFISFCKGNTNESELKAFIVNRVDSVGWKTSGEANFLDFFPDGRIHIQGPEGEATMWEGKWSIKGNQITIQRGDTNKTETLNIQMEGENLNIGGKIYERIIMAQ